MEGAHKGSDYTNLNPNRVVPTLKIGMLFTYFKFYFNHTLVDGLVLNQSLAILEYIEETRPEPALLPKDAASRAKVREIMQIIG